MGNVDRAAIAAARLEDAPIEQAWIVSGAPVARCSELTRSRDGMAATFVWDCTAGEFDWTFFVDETVHILEGEVFIDEGSGERRLGPGDVVLFHAGSTCRWRVPAYVKKLAFLRDPVPQPAVLALRGWRRLKALAGRATCGITTSAAWRRGAVLLCTASLAVADSGEALATAA